MYWTAGNERWEVEYVNEDLAGEKNSCSSCEVLTFSEKKQVELILSRRFVQWTDRCQGCGRRPHL